MWQVKGFPLLAACFMHALSYPLAGPRVKKAFICESHPDLITSIEEHALNPYSDIAARSFLMSVEKRWPHGIIPYEMDARFSEKQKGVIKTAMKIMSDSSCVRWVKRFKQQDYVSFIHVDKKDKCNSVVGRKGGKQVLNLGDNCFDVDKGYQGAILHEMMHTIGFIHEQQRIDRDCYVGVTDRAAARLKFDYGITPNTNIDFPYDFGSIMHYGSSDFMRSHKGERLGNFDGTLTILDKMKLNNMYCKGPTYCENEPRNCAKYAEAQMTCEIRGT